MRLYGKYVRDDVEVSRTVFCSWMLPLMGVEIAFIDCAHQLFTYPNFSLIRTNFLSLLAKGVRINQSLLYSVIKGISHENLFDKINSWIILVIACTQTILSSSKFAGVAAARSKKWSSSLIIHFIHYYVTLLKLYWYMYNDTKYAMYCHILCSAIVVRACANSGTNYMYL